MPLERIEGRILLVRGMKVMMDADLAQLYAVPTKRLNEQVKRNAERLPQDFVFRLTPAEVQALNRSQIATGSQKHRDPRFAPFAFTEHGAIMAANVLASPQAVEMSVYVVRAFVRLRETVTSNQALSAKLDELERKLHSCPVPRAPDCCRCQRSAIGTSPRARLAASPRPPRVSASALRTSSRPGCSPGPQQGLFARSYAVSRAVFQRDTRRQAI